MATAVRTITRVQDADDLDVSLGAGVDEYALCWDNDTAQFVLRAASGAALLAAGTRQGATSQAQEFVHGINLTTDGSGCLVNTHNGANSDGLNLWLGGGGQSTVGREGYIYEGSANTSVGRAALNALTRGYHSVGVGTYAGYALTTGAENTAVGYCALYPATEGNSNVAIGSRALVNLVSGSFNTVVGMDTGSGLVSGNYNTIIGANVTGLAADLTGVIILADGYGNRRIYVDGAGNVGLGTVTPSRVLTIKKTDNASTFDSAQTAVMRVCNASPGIGSVAGIQFGHYYDLDARVCAGIYSVVTSMGGQASADLTFGVKEHEDKTTITEYMRLQTGGNVGIGTTAPATKLHTLLTDAGTNAVANVATIGHHSSGTPAAGYGAGLSLQLQSSTTAAQDAALIAAVWADATHATRKADLVLAAYDTAAREGLRIRANGSAPAIGFLGATPVARPTGVAVTAEGIHAALVALGLIAA